MSENAKATSKYGVGGRGKKRRPEKAEAEKNGFRYKNKRFVEAQGGTITFETEKGKGTKFIIKLPNEATNHGRESK